MSMAVTVSDPNHAMSGGCFGSKLLQQVYCKNSVMGILVRNGVPNDRM